MNRQSNFEAYRQKKHALRLIGNAFGTMKSIKVFRKGEYTLAQHCEALRRERQLRAYWMQPSKASPDEV